MSSRGSALRVLLVEDDEEDFLITRDLLASQDRARFALDWCADYAAALAAIAERRHDVYLVDFRLGSHTGLELIREAFASRPRAPVILLTGLSDYEIDLEATALGVTDYLVKRDLDPLGLERAIRYAVSHQRALDELRRSEERYALAVRAANDGLWDWDLETGQIYLSPRWGAILGLPEPAGDAEPDAWFERVHPDDLPALRAAVADHAAGRTPHLESEHRMRHADGTWRWTLSRGLAIRGPDGAATRMAGSLSDVTERRTAERRLQHDALHDQLTGLPNRALFMDRVAHVKRRLGREPELRCAVLFLDIDRFKLVNDSLGHPIGDRLLVELAARVAQVLRASDTVARIGGDEFTILLEDVDEDAAAEAAQRIQEVLLRSFVVEERELFVTASIGVALLSAGDTPDELLRNADIAMYDAKRRGGERIVVFDESMHRRRVDRLSRENDLRLAVEQGLLDVHYQPIVDLETHRVRGLEALARWPAGWPVVTPNEFIPIAEETGLIGPLGESVLRSALGVLRDLRASGLVDEDVPVSVNLSARQLDDPRLPQRIAAALEANGLPPGALQLEITESTLMREPERLEQVVSGVCATGVGLHLDDFGTGYSSLAALQELPVGALKVDRTFVAALTEGSDVIVRSTIAMAHNLGIRVIAEGIEEPAQLAHLRALGCEDGQGYLFSRPVAAPALRELLAGWRAAAPAVLAG